VSPLFVLLPLLDGWRERRAQPVLVGWLVAGLVGAALLGPWAARNHSAIGKPVLVSTNFGFNLWMGNNPQSNGGYMDPLPDAPKDEVTRERYYRQKAIDYIVAHPADYLVLAAKRARLTFDRESIGIAWNEAGLTERGGATLLWPLKALSSAYWWAAVLAAIAGLGWALRKRRIDPRHALWWASALLAAVPILTVGQDRYHVPLNPVIAMLAAFAWTQWRAASRKTP
jgi:hypothetical protein